jgi:hypothetical protein
VLKNFLKTDYRGVAAHLADHPTLLSLMNLCAVPHFTTLQEASVRLLKLPKVRRLLESTIRLYYGRRRRVKSSAIDSTGLECSSASPYFVRRRNRRSSPWKTVVYHRYPKLGLVCDTSCHFILALDAGRGLVLRSMSFGRWLTTQTPAAPGSDGCRRRLRLGTQSPFRARGVWNSHSHSSQAWSPDDETRYRLLSPSDASAI